MSKTRYKSDNPDARQQLEQLVDDYQHKLVHHAFFRIGQLKDAEDIVQEVFIRIYHELNKPVAIVNLPAYAFRLVANACIDLHRKTGSHTVVAFDSISEMATVTDCSTEDEIIRQEDFTRINQLLASIPAEQSEVIRFRFVDGLQFQQIADILQVPITTVKSRFSYGIQKIKSHFFNQTKSNHAMQHLSQSAS